MEEFEIEDQRPDEEIVLIRHMHPWVLAKTGFIIIIITLLTVIAFLIWGQSLISFTILGVLVILGIIYISIRAFLYRNALFILTNHRVINIMQQGLFRRIVQETELENIYNLEYKISGPIQSLLNFGDLELTTVGESENAIHAKNIENPHFVHEKISVLRKKQVNRRTTNKL